MDDMTMTDRHPSGWKHIAGYCPSTVVENYRWWYCNRTIKRDGLCEIHASAADRAKARGGSGPATYAQLRAERNALAATVERVRALADGWRASGFDKSYDFSFDLFRVLDGEADR